MSTTLRVTGSYPLKAKTRATGSICEGQLDLKADGKVGFGPLVARRLTEIGLQMLFRFPLGEPKRGIC